MLASPTSERGRRSCSLVQRWNEGDARRPTLQKSTQIGIVCFPLGGETSASDGAPGSRSVADRGSRPPAAAGCRKSTVNGAPPPTCLRARPDLGRASAVSANFCSVGMQVCVLLMDVAKPKPRGKMTTRRARSAAACAGAQRQWTLAWTTVSPRRATQDASASGAAPPALNTIGGSPAAPRGTTTRGPDASERGRALAAMAGVSPRAPRGRTTRHRRDAAINRPLRWSLLTDCRHK